MFLLSVPSAPRGPPFACPPPRAGLRPRGKQCLTGAAAQRQEWEISGREGGRHWGSAGAPGFLKFKLLPDQYKSRTRHWLLHGFMALKTRLVRDSYINFTLFNIFPPVCSKWGATFILSGILNPKITFGKVAHPTMTTEQGTQNSNQCSIR